MPLSPTIIVVEDGSIVADANSYIDYDYAESYHALRGNSAWLAGDSTEKEYAIIRATQAVDSIYKTQWEGSQTEYGTQELEWPRKDVYVNNIALPDNLIPTALKKAICEAALREFTSPNSLTPDLDRGGKIKKVKADTVEVEYMEGASGSTSFTAIDGLLADLISGASADGLASYDINLGG
jgi:hypothetical protein